MLNSKIAILARPRSGSTSLYKLFKAHLEPIGFKAFYEPYNPRNYVDYYRSGFDFDYLDPLLKFDKIIIKTLFGCRQYPVKSIGNSEYAFGKWMLNFFDKVIVLDRRDKKLQAESLLANMLSGIGWDIPKVYETDKIEKERLDREIASFQHFSRDLEKSAKDNNWPMFYYEDLFIDHNTGEIKRMFDYVGIEMNEDLVQDFIISDARKVRIDPH